ncbi:MAG: DNA recombination protein RmuC [Terriglobia bacterium]
MNAWIALAVGIAVGAALAWVWSRARTQAVISAIRIEAEGKSKAAESALFELRIQLQDLGPTREALKSEQIARVAAETRLEETRAKFEEQKQLLEEARAKLADTFHALSAEALKSNNQSFMALAKSAFETIQTRAAGDLESRQKEIRAMVEPLKESLDRYERQIQEMEKTRQSAYGGLEEQLRNLSSINQQLQKEAGTLSSALRGGPQVRGRWGEMTLRRAAELAGMSNHCDFTEQETFTGESGRLRPDMVVNLPAGCRIAVDAKVPLQAFLDAAAATSDDERASHLARHSRLVRDHMNELASKLYWQQFEQAPEIVVLFLPGESFFSAALEQDRDLIEDAMQKRVVLATPTTFVALLKAVAYGWRQESMAQNAQEISDLGKQLYDRLRSFLVHFTAAGAALGKAVTAYNNATGSLESRVLVPARKFKELGAAGGDELAEAVPLEVVTRELAAPERGEDSATITAAKNPSMS